MTSDVVNKKGEIKMFETILNIGISIMLIITSITLIFLLLDYKADSDYKRGMSDLANRVLDLSAGILKDAKETNDVSQKQNELCDKVINTNKELIEENFMLKEKIAKLTMMDAMTVCNNEANKDE